jgi:hypothetical protein
MAEESNIWRKRRIGDNDRKNERCSLDNASFNHSVLVWSAFSSGIRMWGCEIGAERRRMCIRS